MTRQLDAQPFTRGRRRLLAAVVDSAHLVAEQGVEEARTEVLHPLVGRSAAGSQDSIFDGRQFGLQRLGGRKGERHRRPRLTGRRVKHSNGVGLAVAGADFQVEVAQAQDFHG